MNSLRRRFTSKVEKTEQCWLWNGGLDAGGYGKFWTGGHYVGAHRVSYEIFVGAIPAGLTVDHLCRVRRCVNPAHLEAVTLRENAARRGPFQPQALQTHCVNGHPFDAANTYLRPGTQQRCCRACNRAAVARRRARLAA